MGKSKVLKVSYDTFTCELEGFDDPFAIMEKIVTYFGDRAGQDPDFAAANRDQDIDALVHKLMELSGADAVDAEAIPGGIYLRNADADVPLAEAEPEQTSEPDLQELPQVAMEPAEEPMIMDAPAPAPEPQVLDEPLPETAFDAGTEAEPEPLTLQQPEQEPIPPVEEPLAAETEEPLTPTMPETVEEPMALGTPTFGTEPAEEPEEEQVAFAAQPEDEAATLTTGGPEMADATPEPEAAEAAPAPELAEEPGLYAEAAAEPEVTEEDVPSPQLEVTPEPEIIFGRGEPATVTEAPEPQMDGPAAYVADEEPIEEPAPEATEQTPEIPAAAAPLDLGQMRTPAPEPEEPAEPTPLVLDVEDDEPDISIPALEDEDEPALAIADEEPLDRTPPEPEEPARPAAAFMPRPEPEVEPLSEPMVAATPDMPEAQPETEAQPAAADKPEGMPLILTSPVEAAAEEDEVTDVAEERKVESFIDRITRTSQKEEAPDGPFKHLQSDPAPAAAEEEPTSPPKKGLGFKVPSLGGRWGKDKDAKPAAETPAEPAPVKPLSVVEPASPAPAEAAAQAPTAEDNVRDRLRLVGGAAEKPAAEPAPAEVAKAPEPAVEPPAAKPAAEAPKKPAASGDNEIAAKLQASFRDGPDPAMQTSVSLDEVVEDQDDGEMTPRRFARQMGASSLADLMDSAAAYLTLIEGKEAFSRAEILTMASDIGDGQNFSAEAKIKSFGKLMRGNRLIRVEDGRFVMSDAARSAFIEKMDAHDAAIGAE